MPTKAVKITLAPVPNVPCGVESEEDFFVALNKELVPNVPCGVERST